MPLREKKRRVFLIQIYLGGPDNVGACLQTPCSLRIAPRLCGCMRQEGKTAQAILSMNALAAFNASFLPFLSFATNHEHEMRATLLRLAADELSYRAGWVIPDSFERVEDDPVSKAAPEFPRFQ